VSKLKLLVIGSSISMLAVTVIVSAQTGAPSTEKKPEQRIVRYEAEDGLPKDKAGEKRRDYAVLEAALNDLASPKNPELPGTTSGPTHPAIPWTAIPPL
jgi:hypothetical protein